ncbi:hypothetical protein IFM89_017449 [Coptis chinensis]|uniref:FAR1 domain-containing protein n=1 Tax=Coptis chinensis TaxID=261450 RepID=A0A835I3S8_9MAGN|nr:hypothetical protein IFM89_017449 [Coptis chinensis]
MNHISKDDEEWLRNTCSDSFRSEEEDESNVSMVDSENDEVTDTRDTSVSRPEADRIYEEDKITFYSLQFKTLEEAYKLYNDYAKVVGFNVRKDTLRVRKNGDRVKRRFLCSAAGERDRKRLISRKRKRAPKATTRFKCEARFEVGYDFQAKL